MSDPFGPGRKEKTLGAMTIPAAVTMDRVARGAAAVRGGSNEPPDLDDLIRKAQDNLRNIMPFDLGPGATVGLFVLIGAMLWMSSGLTILNPGEHAVIQRFGAWNHTKTTEGLGYHMPYPIETLTKVNVTELRRMAVGFTEGMTGTGGKVDKTDESLMLTADRNIVNLQMSLQWNIKSAEDYSFNINDPDQTIKKVAESAIREVVGQTSMFPIITTERALLATKAKDILQKNLDEYKSGVNITQVLIQKAEVHLKFKTPSRTFSPPSRTPRIPKTRPRRRNRTSCPAPADRPSNSFRRPKPTSNRKSHGRRGCRAF